MALTAEQKVSQGFIDQLQVIAAQVAEGSSVTQVERNAKRNLEAMAAKLRSEEMGLVLYPLNISSDYLDTIAQELDKWASQLVPVAQQTWNRDEVTSKLAILAGFDQLGYLSDEQREAVTALKASLSVKRSSGGTGDRAARSEQPSIPGRPAKVAIIDQAGNVFSTQRGDTATSTANLKARVGAFIKQQTGEAMPAEVGTAVLAAAKEVCENGKTEASFAGITFKAVA